MEPLGVLGWVGCSGVNSAYGEAPRPPMGIGGGLGIGGASSYMVRQKPAWPGSGSGLGTLEPPSPPLMTIEMPPMGVCVWNSGPCGVIGLGRSWTGPRGAAGRCPPVGA